MKKLNFTLVIVIILTSAFSVYPQVNQDWVQRYNGPVNGSDHPSSMAVDSEGNVYVTGISRGILYPGILTIKYNSAGTMIWERRFGAESNPANDWGPRLAIDNSGNVCVAGSTIINGLHCSSTFKYNPSGVELWEEYYWGCSGIQAIEIDNSGNIYTAGSYSDSLTEQDFITIKYNSSGEEKWAKIYGAVHDLDGAMALDVDNSGNVYVTGYNYLNSGGSYISSLKYDSSGTEQWVQHFGTATTDFSLPYILKVDNSGNVLIGGATSDTGAIIKYNASGILQYVIRDMTTSLSLDRTGNIYAVGLDIEGAEARKYNSAGIRQWNKRIYGYVSYEGAPIVVDSLDNVYICYSILDTNLLQFDYATIKFNSEGDSQWVQIYKGPANYDDYANLIAADNSGNVYVSGRSGILDIYDYATIKYSQTITGIYPNVNETAKGFKLEQNYPNPFNPVTKINYELGITNYVSLKVFNILGKEVAILVSEKKNAGSYGVEFNAGNLSSGVYFYKIEAGNFKSTKRMTLIK